MKLKKVVTAITGSIAALLLVSTAAGATVSVPENPVPISSGAAEVTVPVNYSGFTALAPLFFHQCKKNPTDPTFNLSEDCSTWTAIQVNGTSNPTGSGVLNFKLFRGDEPGGDKTWGCYSADQTPTPGYEKFTTCYIRVTQGEFGNNAQAQGSAFTFAVQGAPIPEAPIAVILPVIAAGVLAAAFVLNRRRSADPTVV